MTVQVGLCETWFSQVAPQKDANQIVISVDFQLT